MSFTCRLLALTLVLGCSDATGGEPTSPDLTDGAGGMGGRSQVQFGYEITSDASTQAYVTKKFTVSSD